MASVTVSRQTNTTIVYRRPSCTYEIKYEGQVLTVTVASHPSVISKWVEEVISNHEDEKLGAVVGFDVTYWKTRPTFHLVKKKKLATLQFFIAGKCLIIQLCRMEVMPDALKMFLINPNFTFAAVKGGLKMAKLRKDFWLQCSEVATIHLPARKPLGFFCSDDQAYADTDAVKKIKKPKHVRVDDWSSYYLSEDQVLYASLDAYASFYNAKLE